MHHDIARTQEAITSKGDTQFLGGNSYRLKPLIFFLIFILLHQFVGPNPLEESTPKNESFHLR